MSIAEMIFTAIFVSDKIGLSFLRILRILRVLRILRLMRSWQGLYKIIRTFIRAVPQMVNIFILIMLCMFMFSLLGMQLFGGIYSEANGFSPDHCPGGVCAQALEEKPRFHFDYCGPAMITIFILLTGEWVEAMEPVASIEGPSASAFFILVVLVGKFMLMNLLVAVILHEFADDTASPGASPRKSSSSPITARDRALDPGATAREDEPTSRFVPVNFGAHKPSWPKDYSLLIFPPNHGFRLFCGRLIQHPWFDRVIIVAIILSSIGLALDSPRNDPQSDLVRNLAVADVIFTAIFFIEMSIKIVAFGFACGKGSYLSSAWNQVDFAIVMVSLLVLLAEAIPQLRSLRVLRIMRVLRPLRLVSRNAGMRLIITSLFKAMPAVVNVFGVVIMLQVVFAIIGIQLFSGTMASCTDPTILVREDCLLAAAAAEASGEADSSIIGPRWINDPIGSFDDFGSAMRLLYVMSSGDQWENPMYVMMGAQEPGRAPERNDFSMYAAFPIAWMFAGYIFAINLFVGVVVDNFSRMQQEENGSATMTIQQQQWAGTMRASMMLIPSKAPRVPTNPFRATLYKITNSAGFDGFITIVIMSNIFVMSCDYYGIEDDALNYSAYSQAMLTFNYIYYAECVLKLMALGPKGYFGDAWCCFDFFLVCTSLVDQYATELLAEYLPMPPMLLRVLRIFRILRILRLLRHAKGLRDLIITMILSFPSLLNVGSLLTLIIFIYAVLGRQLFTYVAIRDQDQNEREALHGGINTHRNFATFGSSFLLLFQCLTGDGWSGIMADSMIDETTGLCSEKEGNCGSVTAVPFFITFQIVGCFVFVNLIVAVILENFATLHNINPDLVSQADLELFGEAWTEFDPDATNYIHLEMLPALLLKLPRPLGLKGKSELRAKQLCMRLRISPTRDSMLRPKIEFRDVLLELIDNNYFRSSAELDEDDFYGLVPKLNVAIASPDKRYTPVQGGEDEYKATVAGFFAIKALLQDHVKGMLVDMLHRAQDRIAARGGKKAPGPAGRKTSPDKSINAGSAQKGGSPKKTLGKKGSSPLPPPAPITVDSGALLHEPVAYGAPVASCNGRMSSKVGDAHRTNCTGVATRQRPSTPGLATGQVARPGGSPPRENARARGRAASSDRPRPKPTQDAGTVQNATTDRPQGRNPSGYAGYAQSQLREKHTKYNKYLDGQRSPEIHYQGGPNSPGRQTSPGRQGRTSQQALESIADRGRSPSSAELDRLAYGSESAAMSASGLFTSLNDPRTFGYPNAPEERSPMDFASSLLQNGRYSLPSNQVNNTKYSA